MSITQTQPDPASPSPNDDAGDDTNDDADDDVNDDADDAPETGPLRRCIVTRERDYRPRMIRFVVGPDRAIVPDLAAKLPGRGIWLSARRDVVETARLRGAFARAAKAAVSTPVDLTGLVEAGLVRRVTELLGLARRAGQAICGFQKGREQLQHGRVALVIQASDGSPDERARFLSGVKDMPVATPLPAAGLGAVFGRDHVVHAVITHGRLAETLAIETGRLAGIAGHAQVNKARGGAAQPDGTAPGGDASGSRLKQPTGEAGGRVDGTDGR